MVVLKLVMKERQVKGLSNTPRDPPHLLKEQLVFLVVYHIRLTQAIAMAMPMKTRARLRRMEELILPKVLTVMELEERVMIKNHNIQNNLEEVEDLFLVLAEEEVEDLRRMRVRHNS
jgi:hypothetical protein